MLNELLALERGLATAGLLVEIRHPDITAVAKGEILRARLRNDGSLAEVELVHPDLVPKLWTLRDGKHNSFPFVQLKHALLSIPDDDEWRTNHAQQWRGMQPFKHRKELRGLAVRHPSRDATWINRWPGEGLLERLRERLTELGTLRCGQGAAVPAVFERFLIACGQPHVLMTGIVEALLAELDEGEDRWLEVARRALVESCSLYFDVSRDEFSRDVADPRLIAPVSRALAASEMGRADGRCALTGAAVELLAGNFPQPNLPLLGSTYLFSKNPDIRAAGRYGQFAAQAFPVGREVASRLAGAVTELTAAHRKGKTWRIVPGERPKESDLLVAFVEAAPDVPVADDMAEDDDDAVDPEAAFELRTRRLIDAVEAKVGAAWRDTPVQVCLLRKVDPANRKAIFHRRLTVGELYDSAVAWRDGEKNLPGWLTLPVPETPGKAGARRPPHVAPLQVPALSRRQYIRGGRQHTELAGLPAVEAFGLFLNEGNVASRARSVLGLMLRRYGDVLSGSAHGVRRGLDHAKPFDRSQALRAITVIGVLLRKLGHVKEEYMNEAAFKLGQFLAVADVVHVGYCADVRGGDVPPTLLGNAVLPLAQSNPVKALDMLARRWKPYGAWANRDHRGLADEFCDSGDRKKITRGWAIRRATANARRFPKLAAELHVITLPARADDNFRAELLLGYIAGLPRSEDEPREPSTKDEGEISA